MVIYYVVAYVVNEEKQYQVSAYDGIDSDLARQTVIDCLFHPVYAAVQLAMVSGTNIHSTVYDSI